MRKFVNDNKHIKNFSDATTGDVCAKIIIPATSKTQSTYMNAFLGLTDDNDRNWLGTATVFVSHPWLGQFSDLVEVIEQHSVADPNAYFWIDIFVNKQNNVPEATKQILTTVKDNIKAIGTVLLVLSPWNDPLSIGRAWCMWEIFSALSQNTCKLVMRMPKSQAAELTSGIMQDPTALLQSISDLTVEAAQATKLSERKLVLAAIAEHGGPDYINPRVKERLRDWHGQTLKEVSQSAYRNGQTKKDALVLSQFGFALEDLGLVGDALLYKERSLEIYIDTVGNNHPNTATAYNNIGSAYESIENYDKAVEYFEKAYKIFESALGPDHPNTMQCKQNYEFAKEGNADAGSEYEEVDDDGSKCKCSIQ